MKRITLLLLFAVSAQADTLLVLNKRDATLAFLDPAIMKVLGTVPTGEGPHEVAVSEAGKIAVVCNYGTASNPGTTLSVVDVEGRRELRRLALPGLLRPHGITAVGSRFYFTTEGSRAIARYDAALDRIDWISGTGQDGTHMLVVLPGEKKIYTANIGSNSVSLLDLTNAPRQVGLKQIAVVKGPEGIDLSPDGSALWVAGRTPEGGISVIDPKTGRVARTIATNTKMANRVKFTRDGTRVLVSDPMADQILVFDSASGEIVAKIATASGPSGMIVAPDGKRVFVACAGANKVQIIDLATLKVSGEVQTGNEPDGMAYAVSVAHP